MELGALKKNSDTTALFASPGFTGITVDKSVEFSYEELAEATNEFSNANKIGQGGFGSVYFAELRGEVPCHKFFAQRYYYFPHKIHIYVLIYGHKINGGEIGTFSRV